MKLFLLALILTGCTTITEKRARVYHGMTRNQLLDLLGTPETLNSNGSTEGFYYPAGMFGGDHGPYCVIVENGVVTQYGFGSPITCGR